MTLSTTVDATYGDDPANPSQKQHQQDHDVIHTAVNTLPTTYGLDAVDQVRFVSKSSHASDSNTGLALGTPFATIGAALTALGTNPGRVVVGAGTWTETLTLSHTGQQIVGAGPYATVITSNTNGTVITLSGQENTLRDLSVTLGSGATTATAIDDSGFSNKLLNVHISGQSDGATFTGQTGIHFSGNAGDSVVNASVIANLGVGVQADSGINYVYGCLFSTCVYGVQGGDVTGVNYGAGLVVRDSTFNGAGTSQVNINGTGATFDFDDVWFDGGANVAVTVGAGTYGPTAFRLNSRFCAAKVTNVVLNAAGFALLASVKFTAPGGFTPTDLTINATNCATGLAYGLVPSSGSDLGVSAFPGSWTVLGLHYTQLPGITHRDVLRHRGWPIGYYQGSDATGFTTLGISQGTAYASPIDIPSQHTVTKIGVNVTGAGQAGALIRLGIYKDSDNGPSALLIDAGTVAGDATGYHEITISQLVPCPGRYWLIASAQSCPSTGPTVSSHTLQPLVGNTSGQASAQGNSVGGFYATGVTGALPGTFTLGGTTSGAPRVVILTSVP